LLQCAWSRRHAHCLKITLHFIQCIPALKLPSWNFKPIIASGTGRF